MKPEILYGYLNRADAGMISIMLMPHLESKNVLVEADRYNDFNSLNDFERVDLIKHMVFKIQGVVNDSSRKAEVVLARHIIHYLAYINTDLTYRELNTALFRKHHATIMHSVKTVRGWMDYEPGFRDKIELIADQIGCES